MSSPSANNNTEHVHGNVILISSDGVRFRVHAYYLQAHSQVFRDALSAHPKRGADGEPKPLKLSADFETSSVMHDFLDCLVHGRLPPFLLGFGRTADLVRLLDKYDCAPLRARVLEPIVSAVRAGDVGALEGFKFGAALGEVPVCAAALRSTCDRTRPGHKETAGDARLSPQGMLLADFEQIPHRFLWALMKVWCHKSNVSAEQRAKMFEQLITSGKQ